MNIEMETETCCLLCGDLFHTPTNIVGPSKPEKDNVFNLLCKLLSVRLSREQKWDFGVDVLPFCTSCSVSAFEIVQLWGKIEDIEREIEQKLEFVRKTVVVSDFQISENRTAAHSRTGRKSDSVSFLTSTGRYNAFRMQVITGSKLFTNPSRQTEVAGSVKNKDSRKHKIPFSRRTTGSLTTSEPSYKISIENVGFDTHMNIECVLDSESEQESHSNLCDEYNNDSSSDFDENEGNCTTSHQTNTRGAESTGTERLKEEETETIRQKRPRRNSTRIMQKFDTDAESDEDSTEFQANLADYDPSWIDEGELKAIRKKVEKLQKVKWAKETGQAYPGMYGNVETTEDGRMFYMGIEIAHNDNEYKCCECDEVFKQDKPAVLLHIRALHHAVYTCQKCGLVLKNPTQLSTHVRRVHEQVFYECKICLKPLKTEKGLEDHKWSHKSEEEKETAIAAGEHEPRCYFSNLSYQCKNCGKLFKKKSSMRHHEKYTHEEFSRHEQCAQCGKLFKHEGSLRKHIKIVHSNLRPFKCSKCPATFKLNVHLKRHMKSIHENSDSTTKHRIKKSYIIQNQHTSQATGTNSFPPDLINFEYEQPAFNVEIPTSYHPSYPVIDQYLNTPANNYFHP